MVVLTDYIIVSENHKSSRKLYKLTCNNCGCDRGYHRKHRDGSGYCRPCFGSIKHSGKKVTQAVKDKMKAAHFLKKDPSKHPMLGKKHSGKTKALLSAAAAKQNKNYTARFLYNFKSQSIMMKSTWEVKYACYLDSMGVSWQYEPSFILSDGRVYLPDFQLNNGDIIEIKGYMREDAMNKWQMFCKEYPDLKKSLITKVDMKQLGLIK